MREGYLIYSSWFCESSADSWGCQVSQYQIGPSLLGQVHQDLGFEIEFALAFISLEVSLSPILLSGISGSVRPKGWVVVPPPPRDNKVIWKRGENGSSSKHCTRCCVRIGPTCSGGTVTVESTGPIILVSKGGKPRGKKRLLFESWLRKELIRLKSAFQSTVPRILHNEQPNRRREREGRGVQRCKQETRDRIKQWRTSWELSEC